VWWNFSFPYCLIQLVNSNQLNTLLLLLEFCIFTVQYIYTTGTNDRTLKLGIQKRLVPPTSVIINAYLVTSGLILIFKMYDLDILFII